jgi:hypothetical protein
MNRIKDARLHPRKLHIREQSIPSVDEEETGLFPGEEERRAVRGPAPLRVLMDQDHNIYAVADASDQAFLETIMPRFASGELGDHRALLFSLNDMERDKIPQPFDILFIAFQDEQGRPVPRLSHFEVFESGRSKGAFPDEVTARQVVKYLMVIPNSPGAFEVAENRT